MRQKLVLIYGLLFVAMFAATASAQDMVQLLKESKAARAQTHDMVNNYSSKTADLQQELDMLNATKKILEKPALTDEQVVKYEKKIEQLQLQIAIFQKQIELASVKGEEARKKESEKIDEALKALAVRFKERNEPLQKAIDEYGKTFTEQRDQVLQLLRDYVRVPQSAPEGIVQANGAMTFHLGQIGLTWSDKDRNAKADASLILIDRPTKMPENAEVLSEVYTVVKQTDQQFVGYVGPFQLIFTVGKDSEYKGRDKLEALLVQLLDIQGLSFLNLE